MRVCQQGLRPVLTRALLTLCLPLLRTGLAMGLAAGLLPGCEESGGGAADAGSSSDGADTESDPGSPEPRIDGGERENDAGLALWDVGFFDAGPEPPRLVFTAMEHGIFRVFLGDLGGGPRLAISSSIASAYGGTWSPSGAEIVFAQSSTSSIDLMLYSVADATLRRIETGMVRATSPSWSPDGSSIVFEATPELGDPAALYTTDRGGQTKVVFGGPGRHSGPLYSMDGTRILFVSDIDGAFDVYAAPIAGGAPVRLTAGSRILGRPALGLDGCVLVFARLRSDQSPELVSQDLCTTGSTPSVVSSSGDSEPAFQREGRYFTFTTTRFGGAKIMVWESALTGEALPLETGHAIAGGAEVEP